VVVAIIAILAAMLLPALSRAREKARQATCVGNLKSLVLSVFLYVEDNDGWGPAFELTSGRPWTAQLYMNKYSPTPYKVVGQPVLKNVSLYYCPTRAPRMAEMATCWGTTGYVFMTYGYRWYNAGTYQIPYKRLTAPSTYWVIADSVWPGYRNGSQVYKLKGTGSMNGEFAIRHTGTANVVFADGSVRSCGRGDLASVGVESGHIVDFR